MLTRLGEPTLQMLVDQIHCLKLTGPKPLPTFASDFCNT